MRASILTLAIVLTGGAARADVATVQSDTFHPYDVNLFKELVEKHPRRKHWKGLTALGRSLSPLYMGRSLRRNIGKGMDATRRLLTKAKRAEQYPTYVNVLDDDGKSIASNPEYSMLPSSVWNAVQKKAIVEGLHVFLLDPTRGAHMVLLVAERLSRARGDLTVTWVEVHPSWTWTTYTRAQDLDAKVEQVTRDGWLAAKEAGKRRSPRTLLTKLRPDPEPKDPGSAATVRATVLRAGPEPDAKELAKVARHEVFFVYEVRGKWIKVGHEGKAAWVFRNDVVLQPRAGTPRRGMAGRIGG